MRDELRRSVVRVMAPLAVFALSALAISCGDSRTPTSPSPSPSDPIPVSLTVSCPPNVTASTTTTTAQVAYPAPAASGGVQPVSVACTPTSGSSFPLGATAVTCRATDARQNQSTCSFSVTVSRLPTLQRTSFLAFGDSITAGEVTAPTSAGLDEQGYPAFALVVVPTASYPTQLQAALRNRYVTQASAIGVVNSGRPGEFASESVRRFSQVMAELRPEVVLLLDGYNDLNTLGTAAIAPAAAAVETMAREARARGARVFVANLTPPREGGRNSIPASTITAYNDRMRAIAAGENAVFVDLYQALVGNLTTYIGVDGLHPTEVGYQRIAETFLAAIQGALEVR